MSTTTTSPALQLAVGALVVRVGAVGARPDDDERHLRMTLGDNRFGDVGGDVGLGAAGHQELGHPRVHPVDRGARLAQRVDLGGVLDHPQPAQHVGGQHRHRAEHLGQRQQVQRGHRVGDRGGDRCRRRAHRRPARTDRRRRPNPAPRRPSSVTADSLQRRQLHPRHHDRRLAGRGQHQRGQPFEGLRARADQIAQVVPGRDDQTRPGRRRRGRGRAARRRCAYTSVLNRACCPCASRLIGAPIAGDLDQVAVGIAAVVRRHRAERARLGDRALGDRPRRMTAGAPRRRRGSASAMKHRSSDARRVDRAAVTQFGAPVGRTLIFWSPNRSAIRPSPNTSRAMPSTRTYQSTVASTSRR